MLDLLLFGEREFHAEGKIGDAMGMKDMVTENGVVANFKVEAEIFYAKTVKGFSLTVEGTDGGAIGIEAFGCDVTESFHELHLLKLAELIHLGHALVAEI